MPTDHVPKWQLRKGNSCSITAAVSSEMCISKTNGTDRKGISNQPKKTLYFWGFLSPEMLNEEAVRNIKVISKALGGAEKQYTDKKFVSIMFM